MRGWLLGMLMAGTAAAAPAPQGAPPAAAAEALFAVEYTVGAAWDASKPPSAQAGFAEHSATLRALREGGQLVAGARYGDKGLVVLRAPSLEAARALVERDPAIAGGLFRYSLHPLSVFYPGELRAPAPP